MTYLVIETSTDYGVVVLVDETEGCAVRAASCFEGRRSLSMKLLPRIDALLQSEKLTLQDLTGIGVGIGPGSFTGLRVGVTTAKILAMSLDKPVYGLGTFHAYAALAAGPGTVVTAARSRRNELYAQIFEQGLIPEAAFTIADADLAARCTLLQHSGPLHVIGAASAIQDLPGSRTLVEWPPIAGLAIALRERMAAGPADDARNLVPAYIANPIITTPRDSRVLPKG